MKHEVAATIIKQLGGHQFIAMTGAKNFLADGNKAHMKIGRNQSGATHLSVELTVMDDYTMTFTKCGKDLKKIAVKEHVYCDQLQSVFTEVTGMQTKL